ncbi:TetR family transcriptional regulator [Arthrobacter woluwensis]|uniref:TetR/AcrR family transcriptional regulator n=1 Tax=Arthrobacter woluwensis TaxID=156980 RepID=UPI000D12182D|nr:TetR family transcriptional regulator [Arthrobacter woluwensis]PSS44754.1 TetR family transcriptional regulator [Arthrobacter woluwensis]
MPDERRTRRTDPERRERIIEASLTLLAEAGVAGTSHRKVAALADVPLGSMTYHFEGMDELLREAFTRFAGTVAEQFEARLGAARNLEEAKAAVTTIITEDLFGNPRDLVLTHELYTLAARQPRFRDITNRWMARSRRALERHFDPQTAQLLDALIEGLTIHRALEQEPERLSRASVADAVERIAGT